MLCIKHYYHYSHPLLPFTLPYMPPRFFFLLAFLWPLPLFYTALTLKSRLSFSAGFLWGIIFFPLHLFPVLILCVQQGYGAGRFIFPVLLVLYAAFHTGIWFWFATTTATLFKKGLFVRVMSWFFWTCFYLLWIPQGVLWISGQQIGYPFSLPLLPLVQHPRMLFLLHIIGRPVLLACMVGFTMLISLCLITHHKRYVLGAFLCILPFLGGYFVQGKRRKIPQFIQGMGYVQPSQGEGTHPLDAAQELYYTMKSVLERHPQLTSLVTPELCFRYALNKHKHVIHLWNSNALHNEVDLFIGASRYEQGETFNSLYWIHKGKIKRYYDKKILLPLAEFVPAWCGKVPLLRNLFLGKAGSFSAGKSQQKEFKVGSQLQAVPAICAEFFFDKGYLRRETSDKSFILLPLLDSFFSPSHNLMSTWAQYKALELNIPVLYVSSSSAMWYAPYQKAYPLAH